MYKFKPRSFYSGQISCFKLSLVCKAYCNLNNDLMLILAYILNLIAVPSDGIRSSHAHTNGRCVRVPLQCAWSHRETGTRICTD